MTSFFLTWKGPTMSSRRVTAPSARANPARRAYTKPTLTTYGRLKDITTGGSGAKSEPSPPKGPKTQKA